MYKAPFDLFIKHEYDPPNPIVETLKDMQKKTEKRIEELDNLILCEIEKVGVHVDKEELLRALAFERGQYERGYRDGFMAPRPWVSVDEAMPVIEENEDFSENVLVTDGECLAITCCMKDGEKTGWRWSWRGLGEITHWMPLPELPKKEG